MTSKWGTDWLINDRVSQVISLGFITSPSKRNCQQADPRINYTQMTLFRRNYNVYTLIYLIAITVMDYNVQSFFYHLTFQSFSTFWDKFKQYIILKSTGPIATFVYR